MSMKITNGRPKDVLTLYLRCPRCGGEVVKSGKRHFYNITGVKEVQAFKCTNCKFQTTKPVDISGNGQKPALEE